MADGIRTHKAGYTWTDNEESGHNRDFNARAQKAIDGSIRAFTNGTNGRTIKT